MNINKDCKPLKDKEIPPVSIMPHFNRTEIDQLTASLLTAKKRWGWGKIENGVYRMLSKGFNENTK